MLRSFWDEIGVIEADYNGKVSVAEYRSKRPGVMDIVVSFVQTVGEEDNLLDTCTVKYSYPNSMLHTYAASKWLAARSLHQVVADAHAARPKAKKKRS